MSKLQEPARVRDALSEQHRKLDLLFDTAATELRSGDRESALAKWNEFERVLLAHLEAEEALVLPTFAEKHPEEAAGIREQHEAIRRQLAELGVGVELRLVDDRAVSPFLRLLRAHAEREDTLMYRWAEESAEPSLRQALAERLRAIVKRG